MNTFDPWLRALAAAGKGPLPLKAAVRGLAWSDRIEKEGSWGGSTLTGTIRLDPDAAGDPLATFTITGPEVEAGVSTWLVSLASGSGANSTGALPADADRDGVVELPCSFVLTPAVGEPELLFGATFTVLGKV